MMIIRGPPSPFPFPSPGILLDAGWILVLVVMIVLVVGLPWLAHQGGYLRKGELKFLLRDPGSVHYTSRPTRLMGRFQMNQSKGCSWLSSLIAHSSHSSQSPERMTMLAAARSNSPEASEEDEKGSSLGRFTPLWTPPSTSKFTLHCLCM